MKLKSPVSAKFTEFLNVLTSVTAKPYKDVTYQIYYDLFKIRDAQWRYKVDCKRDVDFSLSEIFQDLLIHYMRTLLPKEYEIQSECTIGKIRPDILIKRKGVNCAVIEVKTSIGWSRKLVRDGNYLERLRLLSKTFNVPLKRTFYIFEEAKNVNRQFYEVFEKNNKDVIKNFIYPLFLKRASAYYLSSPQDRKNHYQEFSDNEIYNFYKDSMVKMPSKLDVFQHIVRNKIMQA